MADFYGQNRASPCIYGFLKDLARIHPVSARTEKHLNWSRFQGEVRRAPGALRAGKGG
jgi:hypothetical protein